MEWAYRKLELIRPSLVSFAASRLSGYDEVTDALAETYLALVEYLDKQRENVPRSWLEGEAEAQVSPEEEDRFEKLVFTILRRRVIQRYRDSERRHNRPFGSSDIPFDQPDRPRSLEGVPRDVLLLQIADLVASIVFELDLDDRKLIRQELNRPLSNRERVRLNRIRQKLRDSVLREFGEEISDLLRRT